MQKVTFLFWNIYGRHEKSKLAREASLLSSIPRLAVAQGVDVFLFAECTFASEAIVAALNAGGVGSYYHVQSSNDRVKFFSRLDGNPWTDRFRDPFEDRLTVLELAASTRIVVAGIHFWSRIDVPDEGDRADLAADLADDIRAIEKDVNYERTVLVGDFNMNPFEKGLVARRSFHAMISKPLARTIRRLGRRAEYPCFYNPMWSCFGDRPGGPPGTFFFSNTLAPTNHFWNMYDQVLLRPDLIDSLTRLEVLDSDGQTSLVTKEGRPKKAMFADHLPIVFELRLQ